MSYFQSYIISGSFVLLLIDTRCSRIERKRSNISGKTHSWFKFDYLSIKSIKISQILGQTKKINERFWKIKFIQKSSIILEDNYIGVE